MPQLFRNIAYAQYDKALSVSSTLNCWIFFPPPTCWSSSDFPKITGKFDLRAEYELRDPKGFYLRMEFREDRRANKTNELYLFWDPITNMKRAIA